MSTELSDQITPATKEDVITALWKAWMVYFNSVPKKESVWVVASQWALETGYGNAMHCYNMGNVKSRDGDGFDFCYFACNEILPQSLANKLQSSDPGHAKITSVHNDGNCIIWFYPKHSACRFRAFSSLMEGAVNYVTLLHKRFDKAWEGVEKGDPGLFSHLLKMQGYYTADEVLYTKNMISVYNKFVQLAFDYDSLPIMTDSEKENISNLVALTTQGMVDEIIK